MTQNFQIHSHNYKLNSKQEKTIQDTIDTLIQKVPYNSTIHMDLDYQKKLFIGKLKIVISKKIFFSHDSAETIPQLVKDLNKKIIKQIMKWKKNRTKQDLTGIINLSELRNKQNKFKKAS